MNKSSFQTLVNNFDLYKVGAVTKNTLYKYFLYFLLDLYYDLLHISINIKSTILKYEKDDSNKLTYLSIINSSNIELRNVSKITYELFDKLDVNIMDDDCDYVEMFKPYLQTMNNAINAATYIIVNHGLEIRLVDRNYISDEFNKLREIISGFKQLKEYYYQTF